MSDDDVIRLPENKWAGRFGWSENDEHTAELLEDTANNRLLLRRIGLGYVWSQIDAADGGYEIVPGMTPAATGYYLCDHPRINERVIGIIPPTDD
jgi:hypothetical protein